LLGDVRMLGAGIDAQVLHLATTERTTRDHALNGLLDHALGETAFEQLARGALLDAAGMTGVPVVDLVGVLLAGECDLVGIDDDDVVAVVDMRGEGRLVLAAETVGDDGGETADDETLGVDHHPLLHHVRRFLRKGCHGSAFCWTLRRWGGKAFLVAWIDGAASANNETAAGKAAVRGSLYSGRCQTVKPKHFAKIV